MVPASLRLRLVLLLFLASRAGGAGQLWAQHPQVERAPDGKGADFDSCTQCHAEKTAGATIHPAVQAGCNACHGVSVEEEQITVSLTAKGNDLCFTCHEEKRPNPAVLFGHPPIQQERCIACHDPHTSANPKLLRRPTDVLEAGKNLCLDCHKNIETQINKRNRHAAVETGCSTCHETHRSEPSSTAQGTFHLAKPQPELCLDCHDAKDKDLQAAHLKQPFERARCTECHNPHGSDQSKLLNNYVHLPFAEKQCDVCHEAAKDGRVVLSDGARRDLCLACHSNIQGRMEPAKFKHAPLGSDAGCVSCHSPHAATYPHQIRRDPVALCLNCHTDQARARVTKAHLHAPVFSMSCLICHEEHGGDRPRRLRAETNTLCLECHGQQAIKIVQTTGPVELFGGKVKLPAKPFDDIRWLQLGTSGKSGHPFANHPVSAEPGKGKPAINCLTCHLPHAADGNRALLVTEQSSESTLCVRCHK